MRRYVDLREGIGGVLDWGCRLPGRDAKFCLREKTVKKPVKTPGDRRRAGAWAADRVFVGLARPKWVFVGLARPKWKGSPMLSVRLKQLYSCYKNKEQESNNQKS